MVVSEKNKRICITLSKDNYKKIERLAKEDMRTVSSYCNKILVNYLKNTNDE